MTRARHPFAHLASGAGGLTTWSHDIGHEADMVAAVAATAAWKLNRDGGLLDRVKRAIADGTAIAAHGPADRRLAQAARELRAQADAIDACRQALIDNAMPQLRLVAAE
jgi:hypothetical protein